MEYITVFTCVITAFCLAALSCAIANIRRERESKENASDEKRNVGENNLGVLLSAINDGFLGITAKQWAVAAVGTVLTGFACFRAQGFCADIVQTAKAIVCCELVMSAAIIDLFTRKIPNKLNLVLYIAGTALLAAEFFFNRENFPLRLEASLIGAGVSFGFLFVMSLATRGGMGMGDVKLIGGVGLAFGIAAVVYSVMYSMVICLFAAIIMLVTGRKKIKDKIPFCPFFFLGLVISLWIGTF